MNVHPIDHGHVALPHAAHQTARPKQIDNQSPTAAPRPDAVPEETASPKHDKHDGEKVPGVIRLLEAGHFKGVADVRLRINFFEQLSARAEAAAQPVVQDESRQLVETVNAQLDELL
ncbi:MAG TPA: hypothetical protein VM243_19215, partial [Phycisphaerae bacterium]|nr:hypothetical protein [Phycisphaerae bacterium]